MPYVPSSDEIRRIRAAIDRASFLEFERIMWLFAFAGLLVLDGFLIAMTWSWEGLAVGLAGSVGGFAVLYWRLRGGHLISVDRELHGVGLSTRAQRAFTALMLRHVLVGRNPLRATVQHDPFAVWGQRVERAQVSEEPSA